MTKAPIRADKIHHDSSELFLSETLPRIGNVISVRIRVPQGADLHHEYLRSRPDGEWRRIPMIVAESDYYYDWWSAEMPRPTTFASSATSIMWPHAWAEISHWKNCG